MKIINKSFITTKYLRALFSKCMDTEWKYEGQLPQRKALIIEVTKRHDGGHCNGRAVLNGYKMWLRLGPDVSSENIAWIFLHELAHIRGYGHKEIFDEMYRDIAKKEVVEKYKICNVPIKQ